MCNECWAVESLMEGGVAGDASRTSCASKRHIVEPSSITSLHHRRPTISRPETFFTVQKSMASSTVAITKTLTKLEENHEPHMYVRIASVCHQ